MLGPGPLNLGLNLVLVLHTLRLRKDKTRSKLGPLPLLGTWDVINIDLGSIRLGPNYKLSALSWGQVHLMASLVA